MVKLAREGGLAQPRADIWPRVRPSGPADRNAAKSTRGPIFYDQLSILALWVILTTSCFVPLIPIAMDLTRSC